MKIGRLAGNPGEKSRHIGIVYQLFARPVHAGELRVGEVGVDRLMADRVQGYGGVTSLGFRNGMMPLHT